MARSLFRDIKRSGCLIFFTTSISLGRRNGCSKTSTIWVEWPFWNSLTKAFQGMAAPSTFSRGDQMRCWRRTSAPICSSQLSTKVALLSLGSLAIFCCLVPFWGATSPSLSSYTGLFFFKFGIACSPRLVGIEGKEGEEWEELRTWGLLLNLTPLFLAAMSSLRPLFLQFNAISSSSSLEVLSRRAITRIEVWTPECLPGSSSASEIWTTWAP